MEKKDMYPSHCKDEYPTVHDWRKTKRAEAKEVHQALKKLVTGCAYTPAYSEISTMRKKIEEVMDALSVRNWGK